MNTNRLAFRRGISLTLALVLASGGCHSIGPASIPRDRFDYTVSMNESWKRQVLLNVVRLRYLDPPSFVDVGQIVSGYTVQGAVTANGQIADNRALGFGGLGGSVAYVDRPTITYTPLTGSHFVRGLMTPIAPENVFFTIQSGWPADAILILSTISINGLKNEELAVGHYHAPEEKFLRMAELMRSIQGSGAVGMKIVLDKEKHETKLITFRSSGVSPETLAEIAECRQLLGLNPNASEFELVFGAAASNDHEIALQTRSLLHILGALSARTEVPPEDVRAGRTGPGIAADPQAAARRPKPQIRCSTEQPRDAYAAVEYRGRWFWVDDTDLIAKRNFFLILLLFTLADTGEKQNLPLITISAQ